MHGGKECARACVASGEGNTFFFQELDTTWNLRGTKKTEENDNSIHGDAGSASDGIGNRSRVRPFKVLETSNSGLHGCTRVSNNNVGKDDFS